MLDNLSLEFSELIAVAFIGFYHALGVGVISYLLRDIRDLKQDARKTNDVTMELVSIQRDMLAARSATSQPLFTPARNHGAEQLMMSYPFSTSQSGSGEKPDPSSNGQLWP